MANMLPATDHEAASYSASLLRAGELVCFPTDTVYGIGAAASKDDAIRRLYAVKGRPPSKPLPLLLPNAMEVAAVGEVTPVAQQLIARFWPGALTIVMKKNPDFRSAALAKLDSVALRVPDHDLVTEIIRLLGEPSTGTSANRSGARPPVSAAEAALSLGEMVSLVIDGGRSPGGVESTVVDVSEGSPKLVREGAVSKRELEECLGRPLESGG